jgi:hypothetical protein
VLNSASYDAPNAPIRKRSFVQSRIVSSDWPCLHENVWISWPATSDANTVVWAATKEAPDAKAAANSPSEPSPRMTPPDTTYAYRALSAISWRFVPIVLLPGFIASTMDGRASVSKFMTRI